MSIGTHFLLVSLIVIGVIGLGNHIYYGKVLPLLREVLGDEVRAKLLPWRQLHQIDDYLLLIDRVNYRPWFYGFLKHLRFVLLMLVPLVLTVLWRMRDAL